MIEDQFSVSLHGKLVGRLCRRQDTTRFIFEENYWNDPNRSILGLQFEENPKATHKSSMRLPPWFSNLLPEGRLRQWIADARHTSTQREMELLAQVGHDLPGAVEVAPANSIIPIEVSDKRDSATSTEVNNDALWSFSLAGVGLKFSMLEKGERLTIPGSGEGGDWIIKLPDPLYPNVPTNEMAMMTLAKAVGIDVPEIRLVSRDLIDELPDNVWANGENLAYAIKRFDRGPNGMRIHMEDMAQVRGFYPEKKYSGRSETIAALIYRNKDTEGLREFARRLAFNIIIGNGDAHLKNWSLIYNTPHIPTLSPAYDIVSTFIYRPKEKDIEDMALKFGRSNLFDDVKISHFSYLDKKLGAKSDLGDVVFDLLNRIKKEWPKAEEILRNDLSVTKKIRAFVIDKISKLNPNSAI